VSFNAGGPHQYEVGGGSDVAVIKRLYINEPNISVSFSPGAWFTSVELAVLVNAKLGFWHGSSFSAPFLIHSHA